MVIEISAEDVESLSCQARECGFENVESYVAAQLSEIASLTSREAQEFARLSGPELAESVAMLDTAMAEMCAGGGRDFMEVIDEIANELNLNIRQSIRQSSGDAK